MAEGKNKFGKLLYTAKVRTIGGREKGSSRSSDGRLDIMLSVPGEPGTGANPEQLLAAGWSASFESAIALAARRTMVALPSDLMIDAEVHLKLGTDGYFLQVRLNISLPAVDSATALKLVDAARLMCPYFKATRGNVDVAIHLL